MKLRHVRHVSNIACFTMFVIFKTVKHMGFSFWGQAIDAATPAKGPSGASKRLGMGFAAATAGDMASAGNASLVRRTKRSL